MPAQRNARARAPVQPWDYSSRLARLRARLRKLMDEKLQELTGSPSAQMRWSATGYSRDIVIRDRKDLVGWPTGVPFGNLSDVPGGQPVMERLLALWTSGVLRFEKATEEQVRLAFSSPVSVLPGVPIQHHHQRCCDGQGIMGMEDPEDPIEEAVWSSDIEVEAEPSDIEEISN